MIGAVVTKLDRENRTVDVVTVEKEPVEVKNVAFWHIVTESGLFSVPLEEGTGGMLLFMDIRHFVLTGEVIVRYSLEDMAGNAIFIPGLNSLVSDYEIPESILLQWGDSIVELKKDELSLECGVKVVAKGEKFSVTNSTGELVAAVKAVLDKLTSLATAPGIFEYVNTAGVVTPCTVNVAAVTAARLELDPQLEKIENFKA